MHRGRTTVFSLVASDGQANEAQLESQVTRGLRFSLSLFAVVLLCFINVHSRAASPRIGFLSPGTPESAAPVLAGLREGLRQHGYLEDTNIAVEYRFAYGQ